MSMRGITIIIGLLLATVRAAETGQLQLARELFAEHDWQACRVEAERVLLDSSGSPEARLLAAAAQLRLRGAERETLRHLLEIAQNQSIQMPLRSLASFEAGRVLWSLGELVPAYESMAFAYLHSRDEDIFLRSGCSLFLLMKDDESLRARSDSLYSQIRSSRDLYDWTLQQECRPPKDKSAGFFALPGEMITGFYRAQVGPAIGMRCSCLPSCSEYFLQACRKHGLLGFPLQADRFFREPSIVQKQINPVLIGDEIRYRDPLCDHDFWLK
jgi:putative component of membrane protein insertase Oxa1/YidC/SpoIIIJ protein YidD